MIESEICLGKSGEGAKGWIHNHSLDEFQLGARETRSKSPDNIALNQTENPSLLGPVIDIRAQPQYSTAVA